MTKILKEIFLKIQNKTFDENTLASLILFPMENN